MEMKEAVMEREISWLEVLGGGKNEKLIYNIKIQINV